MKFDKLVQDLTTMISNSIDKEDVEPLSAHVFLAWQEEEHFIGTNGQLALTSHSGAYTFLDNTLRSVREEYIKNNCSCNACTTFIAICTNALTALNEAFPGASFIEDAETPHKLN